MRALPFLLLAAASLAHAQTPPVMHLGDPAPAMTVVKWLKGTPQTDFKDGKVHVVEFWATWCGPCKVGMPHLSDLAKAYGDKVAFTGVDASERKDDVAKAQAFVDAAHGMMGYNVAYATPHGAMSTDWMKAAGQNGIPCAFVVDKGGRIGWIGHPLMGLQEAVDLALAGKLDSASAKAIDADWEAKMAQGEATDKALKAAIAAGQTDQALKLNEEMGTELPFMSPSIASAKYTLLTAKSPAEAKAYGESLLIERANAPILLQSVASAIVSDKSSVKGDRDYKLAQALVKKSLECSTADYSSTGLLAKIAFGQGDKAEAIRLQKEALALVPDAPAYAQMRTAGEKALAEYQGTR